MDLSFVKLCCEQIQQALLRTVLNYAHTTRSFCITTLHTALALYHADTV